MSWLDQFFTGIGQAPITVTAGPAPRIGITPASTTAAGSMSAADKAKLDGLTWAATAISTGGSGGGGIIFRNGSAAPVTLTGFDVWPFGTLTASNTDYYTCSVLYGELDLTGPVTLGSFTTKLAGSGGSGDWNAFPNPACRIGIPGTYVVPAGKVVLWSMIPTGSPASFPAFQLIGY